MYLVVQSKYRDLVPCAEVSRFILKQTVQLPVLKSVRPIILGQVTKQTASISLNGFNSLFSDVKSTHILVSLYKHLNN
jgi:hypothetical protein